MGFLWLALGLVAGFVIGALCFRAQSANPPASFAKADNNDAPPGAIPEMLAESCVDDVMIPRLHIQALDIEERLELINQTLAAARHRFMPVFEGTLDQIVGMLDLRDAMCLMPLTSIGQLRAVLRPAYYVPSGTPLLVQFDQFRAGGQRIGLVVDEYGELEGLVTLEDLAQEVVVSLMAEDSPFTTDSLPQEGMVIDAGLPLRALNRRLGSHFPLDGPKTLSGLITETLGEIPEAGRAFDLAGYHIEVMQTKKHTVRVVKLSVAGTNPALTPAEGEVSSLP